MAKENTGEWKLLKVWECKGCKLLIRDGREVFDHACTIKEKEDELLKVRKILEEKNLAIEERDKFIESQNRNIDGLESFIKELKGTVEECNTITKEKDEMIDKQKSVIDEHKGTIANQNIAIDEQKKNQKKVVEKIVYLEANASKTGANNGVQSISVDILQRDDRIKDSKDSGYREEMDIEIFERGKGREKIIIKNGKVVKKPDDIIVIGENTSEGFIVKGIYRN